jgi:hypothetical protein
MRKIVTDDFAIILDALCRYRRIVNHHQYGGMAEDARLTQAAILAAGRIADWQPGLFETEKTRTDSSQIAY